MFNNEQLKTNIKTKSNFGYTTQSRHDLGSIQDGGGGGGGGGG